MDVNEKTALITGSGAIGGLGHATARILAAGGANVIITGTDPDRGARVVEDVRGAADAAGAAVAGDQASYLTGAVVAADGGRTAI